MSAQEAHIVRVCALPGRPEHLPLPQRATPGSAGFDLTASAEVVLSPGQSALVPTGLALQVPRGVEGQIRPRSGLALRHRVTVLNSPGTVDSDFRGEIRVLLVNWGVAEYRVEVGDRIAQVVFAPVLDVALEAVEVLGESTRGAGGWGSTGA